jgi:hypothetical protein
VRVCVCVCIESPAPKESQHTHTHESTTALHPENLILHATHATFSISYYI